MDDPNQLPRLITGALDQLPPELSHSLSISGTGADVTYRVRLPVPHTHQVRFLRSTAKRKIVRAGRRGGKTVGASILAVEQFLAGRRILYATPTSDQIQRFWSEVNRDLEEAITAGIYKKNETEHYIMKPGSEARIRAKTAWNADTLRGDYADVLILDEWQLMNESAWEEVGAPMLIDNNGDAIFIYTPPSLHARLKGTVSKARDLRHASKMYERAVRDKTGRWQAFHFTSHDNPYISRAGLAEITIDMTALAFRQEIMAEDIDEVPGALWTRKLLEDTRVAPEDVPPLTRIVIGVDPSGSSTTEAGIVGGGCGDNNHIYIFADRSLLAPSPNAWASAAVNLYHDHRADRICGERNYGGDMIEATIRNVDPNVAYRDVDATRGKMVRAEPIAALFERGVAHIVGKLDKLEEELVSYVPGNPSPNRMDAMVWVGTSLATQGILGLIGYYRSGQAQRDMERFNAAASGKPSPPPSPPPNGGDLDKGVTMVTGTHDNLGGTNGSGNRNQEGVACPNCNCRTVQTIAGGQNRCMECGHQFGEAKTSVWLPGRREFSGGQRVGRH